MSKCHCCTELCDYGCECWAPCDMPYPLDSEYVCELEQGHQDQHRCLTPNKGVDITKPLDVFTEMTPHRWTD